MSDTPEDQLTRYGFSSQAELDAHMELVTQRQAEVDSEAGMTLMHARVESATERTDKARVNQILAEVVQAKTLKATLVKTRKAIDIWAVGPRSAAPCKKGCSHCCNIAVTIPRGEAQIIAAELGIKIAEPTPDQLIGRDTLDDTTLEEAQQVQLDIADGISGDPCPFLENGGCSIYEIRPVACRVHYSADRDSLLCRLVPGGELRTPFFDAIQFINLHVESNLHFQPDGACADIRHWFPKGRRK